MELSALKDKIKKSYTGTKEELNRILELVESDESVFPFNEYEYLICNLIEKKGLTFEKYLEIRKRYHYENPNLHYFELVGKTFGGIMESQIQLLCSELKRSTSNKFDFLLDTIKIEVKAGRAVEEKSKKPLVEKALASNTTKKFDIILEQIKPDYCDVFIWVVVYRDVIVFWVLSSKEVKNLNGYSSKQHATGNMGQFHIKPANIEAIDKYKVKGEEIKRAIIDASKRN